VIGSHPAGARPDSSFALRLRALRPEDEAEALAASAELEADRFPFLLDFNPREPWAEYLRRLDGWRRGVDVPADRVPSTFVVAEVDGRLVGRASIRHRLNPFLLELGGHIGYAVRPQFRRRGYATEILRQALLIARAEGIERVLVTCDEDNLGSARAIERAGGQLEDLRPAPGGVRKRRYWIG